MSWPRPTDHWPDIGAVHQQGPTVKVGKYDGQTSYEAFKAKFNQIAWTNGWTEQDKTDQLAASLYGEAKKVLLDVQIAAHWDSHALHLALEWRWQWHPNYRRTAAAS